MSLIFNFILSQVCITTVDLIVFRFHLGMSDPLRLPQCDHHIVENMDLNICYFANQILAQQQFVIIDVLELILIIHLPVNFIKYKE